MGLDMYLTRIQHFTRDENGELVARRAGDDGYSWDEYGVPQSVVLHEDVAYWRKANAVHNWFVQNVQNGKDDCGEYDVSSKQLHELYDICAELLDKFKEEYCEPRGLVEVDWSDEDSLEDFEASGELESEATRKLPTASGCFFGGTNIGSWYFYKLKLTIEMLDRIFKYEDDHDDNVVFPISYRYSSSW